MRNFAAEARLIRNLTGAGGQEEALAKAVGILAEHCIPHVVVGGFVVQQYGYPRSTADVDVVVPNRKQAHAVLLESGFIQHPEKSWVVLDVPSTAEIHLLRGGIPMPYEVSQVPILLPLRDLINQKLSSMLLRDFADVVELIKANHLVVYPVDDSVRERYREAWAIAIQEKASERLRDREDEDASHV